MRPVYIMLLDLFFYVCIYLQRPINLSQRVPHGIPPAKLRLQKLNQTFLASKIAPPPPSIPNNKGKMEEESMQVQGSPAFKSVHSVAVPREPQQTQRLSPPLPTIVSTHSLHPVITVTNNEHRDIKMESIPESTCASPPIITTHPAASSVCSKPAKENIKETEPVLVPHVNLQRNIITNEELPSSSVQPVPIYGELQSGKGTLWGKLNIQLCSKYREHVCIAPQLVKASLIWC